MKKLQGLITAFLGGSLVYLLLSGFFSRGFDPLDLAAALGVSLILTLIVLPFSLSGRYLNPLRWLKLLIYLPVFTWKMIVANLQVAALVLNPKLPIAPSIIKGKTGLDSDPGKLLLTSSITLTPGTLTVDVEKNDVYIHCVKPKSTEQAALENDVIRPFEKFIKGVTE